VSCWLLGKLKRAQTDSARQMMHRAGTPHEIYTVRLWGWSGMNCKVVLVDLASGDPERYMWYPIIMNGDLIK
jgi:hypothetical protein